MRGSFFHVRGTSHRDPPGQKTTNRAKAFINQNQSSCEEEETDDEDETVKNPKTENTTLTEWLEVV